MSGHKGVPMLYGRGREAAVDRVSGQCKAGRHHNCFSLHCNCPCHTRDIERDAKKVATIRRNETLRT